MTIDMFLGGLMILTMVAGVVIVMTSSRNTGSDRFDTSHGERKGRKDRADTMRDR